MKNSKTLVGISMGEPNGISAEVVLKTFSHDFVYNYMKPVLYGSVEVVKQTLRSLEIENVKYHIINDIKEAVEDKLNIIDVTKDSKFELNFGKPSKEGGSVALKSIDRMMNDVKDNNLEVIVTAPVDKNTINLNTPFTGHTGYIAEKLGVKDHLMILHTEDIRVGLVTEHIPVSKISSSITKELIISKTQVFIDSLINDFGIIKPKIAVLGLNPHAGDGGAIGEEEENIIIPAIEEISESEKAFVFGPYPGDAFWGTPNMNRFDGILAMYHDQGLAPFKALAFDEGVNFTAGLPIIRTSPDHGTAYNIAGKNSASPLSFTNALFDAIKLYANRKEYEALKADFLPFSELKKERFRLEKRDFNL